VLAAAIAYLVAPTASTLASDPCEHPPQVTVIGGFSASKRPVVLVQAPSGSHERYRQALLPYIECIAEMTPEEPAHIRKFMMAALYEDGLPLGPIAVGFKASEDELEYVRDRPPVEPEPVDEQERLAR
jgi:hypothetical protein